MSGPMFPLVSPNGSSGTFLPSEDCGIDLDGIGIFFIEPWLRESTSMISIGAIVISVRRWRSRLSYGVRRDLLREDPRRLGWCGLGSLWWCRQNVCVGGICFVWGLGGRQRCFEAPSRRTQPWSVLRWCHRSLRLPIDPSTYMNSNSPECSQ